MKSLYYCFNVNNSVYSSSSVIELINVISKGRFPLREITLVNNKEKSR